MSVLRPISDADYAAWLEEAVPSYAADKIASGAWPSHGALDRAWSEHEELLPRGKDTVGSYIYSILDASGAVVGTLWFAAEDRGPSRVAYVYNILIGAAHRRQGHAQRAFLALEDEARRMGLEGVALHVFGHNTAARALYAKLGFKPTNFNLYKPVGAADV